MFIADLSTQLIVEKVSATGNTSLTSNTQGISLFMKIFRYVRKLRFYLNNNMYVLLFRKLRFMEIYLH
jgi:hypothetical protein